MAASSAAPPPPQLGAAEAAAAAAGRDNGNSNSGEIEERSSNRGEEGDGGGGGGGGGSGGGSYGGNRWPRPETIALLRIRSEMDSVFRDSTPKAPLWEQVSRKLAELGYHRSAKKCKEKFENVYKYHKRTKDGRTAKHDGKTYRFFEELEAFEGKQQLQSPTAAPPPLPPKPAPALITPALPNHNTIPHQIIPTVPSAHGNSTTTTTTTPLTSFNFTITPPSNLSPTAVTPAEPISSSQPLNPSPQSVFHPSYHHHHHNNRQAATATAHLFSSSTSSSTASDEEPKEEAPAAAAGTAATTRKRKRKWNDFFEKLTRDVIRKQEELQMKFLETVEKLDRERLIREDAWRVQELARINREHEVLVHERSTAAAKDAALLAFLQKMSGQEIPRLSLPPPPAPIAAHAMPQPAPAAQALAAPVVQAREVVIRRESSSSNGAAAASASRWPKVEINALIALRTRLDEKYQENGPKGPLWEEISAEMRKIGYNRSAKRCKEKWENINKYFKKVKESNKRRPENSKTCPYFEQLDALYREKSISTTATTTTTAKIGTVMSSSPPPTDGYIAANPLRAVEPVAAAMPQLQQQWQAHSHPANPQQHDAHDEEEEGEGEEDDDDEEDYEDLETEDDEEGVGVRGGSNGGGFQVVQNRPIAANEQ
ncbi:unnamed protein product [Linum tenue]|uniref:Myb-like domain-containing protein n=1 Tax=Linum tenue TaxID=586396 RepID=A0AAV0IGJ4_9ROSI|nr:unnamed protein product [Linum tenue]